MAKYKYRMFPELIRKYTESSWILQPWWEDKFVEWESEMDGAEMVKYLEKKLKEIIQELK